MTPITGPFPPLGGSCRAWSLVEGPPAGPETWGECLWLPLISVPRIDVFLQLQPSLLHYVSCVPEVVNTRDVHYISHNLLSVIRKASVTRPAVDQESGFEAQSKVPRAVATCLAQRCPPPQLLSSGSLSAHSTLTRGSR